MKAKTVSSIALLMLILGLAGCSRTVEDVSKWEQAGNTEKLKKALTDPKLEVRKAAADSLGILKAEPAVEALAACLNDEEVSVQLAAVDALAAIGNPDTITPLTAALKLSQTEVRIKAANALGTLMAAAAIDTLTEILNSSDEAVQLAACKALGSMKSDAASQVLVAKLNGETPDKLRIACVQALGQSGDTLALQALVVALADKDERIREAAWTALLTAGDPAAPAVISGLKNKDANVRSSAIKLLRGLNAIPTKGDGLVWYNLSRASLDKHPELQAEVLDTLANTGAPAVSTLQDAAALDVPEIREPAALALERIGDACLADTIKKAEAQANFDAKQWLRNKPEWVGAPSPLLDLWGATSVLNPEFTADRKTVQALQAGGSAARRILEQENFTPTRAYIPYIVKLLADEACANAARTNLDQAGGDSTTPLICALASTNDAIAETAADLMINRSDPRAYEPLVKAVQLRLDEGKPLSRSPLYTALLKQDKPETEPILLRIRPNSERAIQVFSRQFRTAKVIGAQCADPYTDQEAPVTIHIAYTEQGKSGSLAITFKKDNRGNWQPSPALPYRLKPAGQAGSEEDAAPERKQKLFGL